MGVECKMENPLAPHVKIIYKLNGLIVEKISMLNKLTQIQRARVREGKPVISMVSGKPNDNTFFVLLHFKNWMVKGYLKDSPLLVLTAEMMMKTRSVMPTAKRSGNPMRTMTSNKETMA